MFRAQFPEQVIGFEQRRYRIKIVNPLTATNISLNPSLEKDTVGWSAQGAASISRISTQQRRGVYSLEVTPTSAVSDGCGYAISLISGTLYFVSVDVLGAEGVQYLLRVGSLSTHPGVTFYGTGKWQRINTTIVPNATATWTVTILKNGGSSTAVFYVDGLQIETGNLTTYLDGSLIGFTKNQAAYQWVGAEHASPSIRSQTTRYGGQEIDLRDYGFKVSSIIGLGHSVFENLATENAFLGGALYSATVQKPAKFDLVGAFFSDGLSELMRNKSDLISALRHDAAIIHQPLLMKIQIMDEGDNPVSEPVEVECLFSGGLEGNRDNYNQERASLSFEIFGTCAAKLDGTAGSTLLYETTLGAGNTFSLVRTNGQWAKVGGANPFDGQVKAIVHDPVRGRIYFGGNFGTVGGNTNCNAVCYLDLATNTFVEMDAGVSAAVETIALAPNGDAYVGGAFLAVGSAATAAKGFARWNVTAGTWTAFNQATATFGRVYSLAISQDGKYIFGGGDFTDWVVGTGTGFSDYWFAYQPSTGGWYGDVGTPTNGIIRRFVTTNSGAIYIGGNFTSFASVAINRLGGWNDEFGGSPSTLGLGGANGEVIAFALGPDGRLYAGGAFTVIGGVTAARVAVWNGVKWEPLGSGATGGNVDSLYFGPDGLLYAGGAFTQAGGVPNTAHLAAWNGSSWIPIDVDLLVASQVVRAVTFVGTDLYIGYDASTPSTTVGGVTTVNNPGSANVYPVFTITGPGSTWKITNFTTGDVLNFELTLSAGEVAVLSLNRGNIKFSSNFRSNLLWAISGGSALATFRLAPGNNIIGVFINGDTAATSVTLEFQPRYTSLDDILYR